MNHSPNQCKICGEYHCLAGCVPIEECKQRLAQKTLPVKTDADILVERFNEWADELLRDYSFTPDLSPNHGIMKRAKETTLQNAKATIKFLAEEIKEGK